MSFEQFDRPLTPNLERELELPITEILKEKAETVEKNIEEISPEAKKKLFDSARLISKNIPEIIITGGTALRIYLEKLNKKVPIEFGEDIDCVIEKEFYEKIREALPPKEGKEVIPPQPNKIFSVKEKEKLNLIYTRKEGEGLPDGRREFLKEPENHLALEDKKNNYHIDIFPKQDITIDIRQIELKGQKINLLSPEELFIRSISFIKKGIENKQLQRRHVNYFYLNGGLINEEKMDNLWKAIKMKASGKDLGDWREVWKEFNENICRAEDKREIKKEVFH
ncbi:MAG: hypothetical protein FJZ05_00470 [Candidatus Nealsonbacteria bacterium]|nr:hypothetical protein [Candidatus Nealsonbacteria bacterium]